MKHYNIDDICIEHTLSGMIECSVIDKYDTRVRMTYIGYNKSKALKQFKRYLRGLYEKK